MHFYFITDVYIFSSPGTISAYVGSAYPFTLLRNFILEDSSVFLIVFVLVRVTPPPHNDNNVLYKLILVSGRTS